MLSVSTVSGTTYLFDDEMTKVKRYPNTVDGILRRDIEWVPLVSYQTIEIGKPMRLLLNEVAEHGMTLRTTTDVEYKDVVR